MADAIRHASSRGTVVMAAGNEEEPHLNTQLPMPSTTESRWGSPTGWTLAILQSGWMATP